MAATNDDINTKADGRKAVTAEATHKRNALEKTVGQSDKPYSIFTHGEKWFIVLLASSAGIFSPLTANIYLPAIPVMAAAFHKSTELINVTVTVYMVFQGITPMFWGTIADKVGRRPIFIACLLTLCLSCMGLALTPTNAYWLLLLLRCLQASGSASTVALGAGVIGDIADRAERGGFFGLYSMGPMVGPCIGPVIGGVLADKLGWRSIFWFLCISSAVCLLFMLLFLPETLRSLVGDGSYTPSAIYRPWIPIMSRNRLGSSSVDKPPKKTFANPLRILTHADVLLLLVYNGVVYSAFYGVTASLSVVFKKSYPFLSETDIGLCYLAIGGGMVFGSLVTGKFLDRDYQSIKNQMIREGGGEKGMRPEDVTRDENFPIERARLKTTPIYLAVFVIATVGYGWCLQQSVNLAVPLILQIIMGYQVISFMNATQTLLVDLMPSQSSSITACNNLVRCSMGAALVAIMQIILDALHPGWTYVLLGGICALMGPLIYLAMWLGPRCRAKRRARNALIEPST